MSNTWCTSKFTLPWNHTSICSIFLMLVSKHIYEDSLGFIDSKKKRKGKLFFSMPKQLQRSRKRASELQSRSESLLECTCNIQELQKSIEERSPEQLQWMLETSRLYNLQATFTPSVSISHRL